MVVLVTQVVSNLRHGTRPSVRRRGSLRPWPGCFTTQRQRAQVAPTSTVHTLLDYLPGPHDPTERIPTAPRLSPPRSLPSSCADLLPVRAQLVPCMHLADDPHALPFMPHPPSKERRPCAAASIRVRRPVGGSARNAQVHHPILTCRPPLPCCASTISMSHEATRLLCASNARGVQGATLVHPVASHGHVDVIDPQASFLPVLQTRYPPRGVKHTCAGSRRR